MIVLTARQEFIAKYRTVLVDFMEDNLRLVRWCAEPSNRDEAIKIASRLTRQPPDRFAGWLFTERDYYRDPDMVPNIAVLQDNIGKQQEAGFLGQPIDISNYVDLTVIMEAAARLR
jgi:NitT/TauT family transport system substrate-binding protein